MWEPLLSRDAKSILWPLLLACAQATDSGSFSNLSSNVERFHLKALGRTHQAQNYIFAVITPLPGLPQADVKFWAKGKKVPLSRPVAQGTGLGRLIRKVFLPTRLVVPTRALAPTAVPPPKTKLPLFLMNTILKNCAHF